MIKSKKLSKFKQLSHGFFNRKGGTSKGIYSSLNCGVGSNDSKKSIKNNLRIVCKKIGTPSKKLILLNQIHSNKFYYIDKNYSFNKKRLIGDALITKIKKVSLGILTADCAPVFIFDKQKKIISAIHAGWRGAYKGIINKVVKFLLKKGSKNENLVGVIGPCIFQKNYEVKKDFQNKFLKKDKKNKLFFKIIKNKTYFSLNNYIYYQFKKLGIKNIEIINKNTFDKKIIFLVQENQLNIKRMIMVEIFQ